MMDPQTAFSGAILPLAATASGPEIVSASPLAPAVIICLCVVAGLSTWLLLPGRRDAAVRRIGGAILLAAGLIFGSLLLRWGLAKGGMSVYFWAFSGLAIFGSVRVITHPRPVYSALYFVLTVFATAGLFVLMWAEFMAAALVLIYAGAILITYVFVIMLASEASAGGTSGAMDAGLSEHDSVSRSPLAAALTGFTIAALLIFVIIDRTPLPEQPARPAHTDRGSAQDLGWNLAEEHAINIQLAGVVLTLAMVGAITLARRRVIVSDRDRASVETFNVPGTPVDDNPHSIPVYGTTNPRHKAYPET